MIFLRCAFLSVCIGLLVAAVGSAKGKKTQVLVLIDPFTSYLSGHCKAWAERHGVRCVEAVSSYAAATLGAEGRVVPESLKAPQEGEEVAWCIERAIISDDEEEDEEDEDGRDEIPKIDDVYVLSESEAGVGTAQRIQVAIGAPGNGHSPQLVAKFTQNQLCKKAGLPTNKQALVSSWEEAEIFCNEVLWKKKSVDDGEGASSRGKKSVRKNGKHIDYCIIKPNRGVATDGVYLCHSLKDAANAFEAIKREATFGELNMRNSHVLIQEYTPGSEEYAVDTVTCEGVTRVTALWKYDKIKANGSPFIYQSSELVDVDCENERDSSVRRKVIDYAVRALQAQDFKCGACHIEVKVHPRVDEPRLMEINARWHAQPFLPLMSRAFGYDSLELTMEALFKPNDFLQAAKVLRDRPIESSLLSSKAKEEEEEEDNASEEEDVDTERGWQNKKVNHAPPPKKGAGAIVHLVQREAGVVRAIRAEAVEALPSCVSVTIDTEVGERIDVTTDHRTHSGTVVLYAKDEQAFKRDYRRLLEMQDANGIVEVVTHVAPASVEGAESGKSKRGKGKGRSGLHSKSRHARKGGVRESPGMGEEEEAEESGISARFATVGTLGTRLTRIARRATITSVLAYTAAAAYITLLPQYQD